MIPLLVAESTTPAMQALARENPAMLVWWATEVECVSALARLEREGDLASDAVHVAVDRLAALADGWNEVQPVAGVRAAARRLLRVHRLRDADALQLAAAVVAAEGHLTSLDVVTLDDRLADAARREGFRVRTAAG